MLKNIAYAMDVVFVIMAVLDFQLTTRPELINATREVADRLSIGRTNDVRLQIQQSGNATFAMHN